MDNLQMSPANKPMDVPWMEMGTKAVLTGAIATAAAALLIPGGSVSVAGISIPGSVGIGLGAAGGSIVGDLAHKYVLPQIPYSEKYEGIESAGISIAAAAAGSALALSMLGDVPIATPILLGGGSFIVGDFVYQKLYSKNTGGFVAY